MSTTDMSARSQEGGCGCRHVRYRITGKPLFVHCCHCRWCQRETGSAFVLNAMIEADRVQLLAGGVQMIDTPSNSGIHIFTASKQPWVQLPAGMPAFAEFYKPAEQWPKDSLNRYAALKARK